MELDFKARARITLPPHRVRGILGDPVRLVVSGCTALPTPPYPQSPSLTAEAASVRGTASLWLPSGDAYLVVDWDWCYNKVLPVRLSSDNNLRLGECNIGAIWQRGRFKMFSINLGQRTMESIYRHVGSPDGNGRWLATCLLPRLRPAAVRLVTPCRVQIWIKLT